MLAGIFASFFQVALLSCFEISAGRYFNMDLDLPANRLEVKEVIV